MNRKILKFSLFSSGKYLLNKVSCSKIYEHKYTTVLEYIFTDEIFNKHDAKLFSLIKCHEQKRKVCFCEICWFLAKIDRFYELTKPICRRYKTKGTPHYPLEEMPINCPYFKIDKEIDSMVKLKYYNAKVEEKIYNL